MAGVHPYRNGRRVEIVKDEKGFHSLEPVWNPLLSRSGIENIYLTFEWLSVWWKHFGHGHRMFIVVLYSGDDVVALFPLMVTNREGFRQLGMISNRIADYKDFIIDSGFDRTSVIREILDALKEEDGWDFLLLNGFSEDSPNFAAFREALSGIRAIWRHMNVSLAIPFDKTFDEYYGRLSAGLRKDLARNHRRLPEGSRISWIEEETDEDRISIFVDKMIDMNATRWAEEKRQYSAYDDPTTRRFFKDIACSFGRRGWLVFPTLIINGEIACINLCLKYDSKAFGLITAYDRKYSGYTPGTQIMMAVIKKCIEAGCRKLDMLTGCEPYKYQFKPRESAIMTVGVFRDGIRGFAASRWFFGLRPRLEKMEKSPLRKFYWWYRKLSIRKG